MRNIVILMIRIINNKTVEFFGVRTADLRKIAKEIGAENWKEFLSDCSWKTHEEKMIAAFLPKYIKPELEFTELFSYFDYVSQHLSSWAQTDALGVEYKQIQNNKDKSFQKITKYLKDKNFWRFV
ncbi:MAG: DNA alkylation repair protein [Bifidobacteriaceae bacterium]|jgi:hypothetical protein|nr:DNA alkylation repair protein [Bifidobacteriaceae bacterium]